MARVLQRYNQIKGESELAREKVVEEMNDMEDAGKERFDMELYRMHHRYVDRLESESKKADEKLQQMQPELDQEQAKVTEARKRRRVIEILKEKEKEKHDLENRKSERKELEESNRMRFSNAGPFTFPFGSIEEKHEAESTQRTDRELSTPGDAYFGESESPHKKRDYVDEYFKNMGMEPPGKKKEQSPLDSEDQYGE